MTRALSWYAVVVVLLVAVRLAWPVTRPGIIGAAGLASIAAIEFGVRRLRPERAGAWRCLQVSLAVLAIGDILYLRADAASPASVPYPSAASVVAVGGYLVLAVALFWLGRPVAPEREETSLIDAISLTLAASLVVWITVLRPLVESQALGEPGRLTAVVAMLSYIAVFAASVRLVLGWRRRAAIILLGVALVWFLTSESFYGHQFVRSTMPGQRADIGYVVLAAGCGAAALTRSMRDVALPGSSRHSLKPWRLALIAIALLVAPGVLVAEALRGPVETGLSIATTGALVSFLVLLRLSMSGRAYRARAGRERAVRAASQAMVSAVQPADVVAGTRNALRTLEPAHGMIQLDLIDKRELDRRPVRTVVATGPADRGELIVPLSGSHSAFVFAAPARVLLEIADLLESLADQAAVALQRISLAEVAGAEERERYFRTLVLTSTDAIIISRDGRIEYATPSADAMFGRNVLGENFNDIVRRPDQRDADPQWPDAIEGAEGIISRGDGDVTVLIHRRDLTNDPTVRGIVTTLRDITAERELQRDLAYRASHDELTGMANARSWGELLASERDRRRGPGNGIAVIFIDLDEFKSINDRYGHPTGDQVLADMARRIRESVRTGDVAARVGGDEFAVLLRGLPSVDDARATAQRLAQTLSRPIMLDSQPIECKASIGLAYSEGQEPIDALVRQADTALYAAKEQGKGRWTEYNPRQSAPPRAVHNSHEHR